jgi:hypothetical protein
LRVWISHGQRQPRPAGSANSATCCNRSSTPPGNVWPVARRQRIAAWAIPDQPWATPRWPIGGPSARGTRQFSWSHTRHITVSPHERNSSPVSGSPLDCPRERCWPSENIGVTRGKVALRREIQERCKVIENWNGANSFILYGKGGEIATNDLGNQALTILALHPLRICLVFMNTLMIQRVRTEPD